MSETSNDTDVRALDVEPGGPMDHRDQLMDTLKTLLRDVLRARFDGAAYAKLARAHGYADGYMRALLDAGLVEQKELLDMVGAERRRFVDEAPATVAA